MNWERRLCEMVLAGGAMVAIGCSSDSSHTSSAYTPGCCNGGTDPCCYAYCTDYGTEAGDTAYQACTQSMEAACAAQGERYLNFQCMSDENASEPVTPEAGSDAVTPEPEARPGSEAGADVAGSDAAAAANAGDAADAVGE